MCTRLAGVAIRWVQFEVVLDLLDGIVVLSAHFQRPRKVIVRAAPPGRDLYGLAQERDGLVERGWRGCLLDLR
jgi:hypothetical protein